MKKKKKINHRVIEIKDLPINPPDLSEFALYQVKSKVSDQDLYFADSHPDIINQLQNKYEGSVTRVKFNGTMIRLTKEMQDHFNLDEKTVVYIREDQHDFLQAMLIGNISFSNLVRMEKLEARVETLLKRYRFFEWVRNLFVRS